jgi:hypothetical protein
LQHALVLGDNMPGSPAYHDIIELAQHPHVGDVAQGPRTKVLGGLFTGQPARTVPAVRKFVLDPRVDDEQGKAGRCDVKRHGRPGRGATVKQQRMLSLAQQHGKLIHQPGRSSDEVVLRAAAKRG